VIKLKKDIAYKLHNRFADKADEYGLQFIILLHDEFKEPDKFFMASHVYTKIDDDDDHKSYLEYMLAQAVKKSCKYYQKDPAQVLKEIENILKAEGDLNALD